MKEQSGVGGRASLRLGFFSVVPFPDGGFIGGFLVLNGVGRPLEFHCTTPVRPTRAQEILYGPTLRPFLFGEQIAPALVAKAKAPVQAVLVSQWESLALGPLINEPVAMVVTDTSPQAGISGPIHEPGWPDGVGLCLWPHRTGESCVVLDQAVLPACEILVIGGNRLAVATCVPDAPARIRALLSPWAEVFDLAEPFERIRAAIEEATRRG